MSPLCVRFVGRRWLFEGVPEVDLIDVMGEASRDESTAIAQRLAAVGELYARRAGDREAYAFRRDELKLESAGGG